MQVYMQHKFSWGDVDGLGNPPIFADSMDGSTGKMPRYRRTFIKKWREHRGLTQEQLSERIELLFGPMEGVSYASISRIERGVQPYNQEVIEAMAKALDVSVPELLERDPEAPDSDLVALAREIPAAHRTRAYRALKAFTDEN